jgi:hypothetical protein
VLVYNCSSLSTTKISRMRRTDLLARFCPASNLAPPAFVLEPLSLPFADGPSLCHTSPSSAWSSSVRMNVGSRSRSCIVRQQKLELFGQQFAEIFQRLNRTSLQLLEFINNLVFKNEKDWRDALADFKRIVMPPPRAQFQRESLTSALNAASALLVIGRWVPACFAVSRSPCAARHHTRAAAAPALQLPLVRPPAPPCLCHRPQWPRHGAA